MEIFKLVEPKKKPVNYELFKQFAIKRKSEQKNVLSESFYHEASGFFILDKGTIYDNTKHIKNVVLALQQKFPEDIIEIVPVKIKL